MNIPSVMFEMNLVAKRLNRVGDGDSDSTDSEISCSMLIQSFFKLILEVFISAYLYQAVCIEDPAYASILQQSIKSDTVSVY